MRLFVRNKSPFILFLGLLCFHQVHAAGNLAFTVQTIDGKTISLSPKGQLVLLDFWASWCKSCEGSWPVLKRLAAKFPDDKLKIVAISLDSSSKNVQNYVKAFKIQSDMVVWDKFDIAKRFSVDSVPTTILVFEGEVVYRTSNSLSNDTELPNRLASLLKTSKPKSLDK